MPIMLNAAWHDAHPMPKRATLDQRVVWHVAHAKACGCRAIPATVAAELKRRGIEAHPRRKRIAKKR
jgi:hypothetical protein